MNTRSVVTACLLISAMIWCVPGDHARHWLRAQEDPGESSADENDYEWRPVLLDNVLPLGKAATSWLGDRYGADKAFDGNVATAWVEDVEGDGIGQKLGFFINGTIAGIKILPGIGVAKYFKLNNRVKKAKFSIYEVKSSGITEYAMIYEFEKLVKTIPLGFKDSMVLQEFPVGVTAKREQGYVGIIEIVEVYKGSKWRDTGIAEVEVVP
jgi:hypothetical protein